MNTNVASVNAAEIMDAVISKGDIGKLTPAERSTYYTQVCRSIGLNPLTRPFEYLVLNGKTVLYARRDAADQLRKINGISVEVVSKEVLDGLLTVHVRATDKTGRIDEDYGVVNMGGLKGEAAANAFLKCVTKAKRRVTLSISGLGFLDETEVDDIPAAAKRAAPPVKLIAKAFADDDMRGDGELVSDDQVQTLQALIVEVGANIDLFLKYFKIATLSDLSAQDYPRAIHQLERKRK